VRERPEGNGSSTIEEYLRVEIRNDGGVCKDKERMEKCFYKDVKFVKQMYRSKFGVAILESQCIA
jgi:hypothetical protein